MRSVSLTMRTALNAEQTDVVPVLLVTITHPSLSLPLRFTSDPTERLSVDPLTYGTRSMGRVFYYALMTTKIPDDRQDTPARTSLSFDNVENDMIAAVRSVSTPASVDIELVLSSAPDAVEARWRNLRAVRASYDVSRITIEVTREPYTSEPWPKGRATASRLPGLHR